MQSSKVHNKTELLTHGLQLGDQLLLRPLLLVAPQGDGVSDQHLIIVRVGDIQVVNQHNVRVLSDKVLILIWKNIIFNMQYYL